MSSVYFNELSATGYIQDKEAGEVIKALIGCINWLKRRNIDVIRADRSLGCYKITDKRTMYQLFNDETALDNDQKALLIDFFSDAENLQNSIEDKLIIESKCGLQNAIGLTVASDAVANGLALSLSKSNWDKPQYTLNIKSLNKYGKEVVST